MPATTGTAIVSTAFALLNVFAEGESIPAGDGELARKLLNLMLSQWRQRGVTVPVIARERFDLVANQGGPDNPYTIGDGGDFDTERPANQNAITSANLILTTTSPEVRVPLGIYTDDAYDANQLPGTTSGQPTALYYNPTYQDDLGSIYLWPVPDVNTNDLELFLQKPLAKFTSLAATVYVPDGADDALTYKLAARLAGPYGRTMNPDDKQIGEAAFAAYKRSNAARMTDLATDATFANGINRTVFNIQTGQ